MITTVGWLVVVVDIAQFVPQGCRAFGLRHRHDALRGLSLWAWSVAAIQAVLWVVYGFDTDRLPIALPNCIIAPICLLVLVVAVRARTRAQGRQL